jgi:hypothetical protein
MVGMVWWNWNHPRIKEILSGGVGKVRGKLRGIFESAQTWSVRVYLSNLVGVCSPRIRQPIREYFATAHLAPSVLAVVRVRSPLGAK